MIDTYFFFLSINIYSNYFLIGHSLISINESLIFSKALLIPALRGDSDLAVISLFIEAINYFLISSLSFLIVIYFSKFFKFSLIYFYVNYLLGLIN